MNEHYRPSHLISFRKSPSISNDKESLIMMDGVNMKVSFHLNNEKDFLNPKHVESNINNLKKTISNLPKNLQYSKTNKENLKLCIKGLSIIKKESLSKYRSSIFNLRPYLDPDKSKEKLSIFKTIANKHTIQKRNEYTIEHPKENNPPVSLESYMDNSKILNKDNKLEVKNNVKKKTLNLIKVLTEDNLDFKNKKTFSSIINNNNNNSTNSFLQLKPDLQIKNTFAREGESAQELILLHENSNKFNDNILNITVDKSEMIIPSNICLICEQNFKNNIHFKGICGHSFCYKCGKVLYEDKVETGEKILCCPDYKCKYQIDDIEISKIISEKHFQSYLKYRNNELNEKIENNFKDDEKFKQYMHKHVIKLTKNNDSFFNYSKIGKEICKKCYEPALFGKGATNVVKCLNCYCKYCKNCLKELTYDHFLKSSVNFCKVYFKKETHIESLSNDKLDFHYFLLSFSVFFFSYFLVVIGIFLIFNEYLFRVMHEGETKHIPIMILKKCLYYIVISVFILNLLLFGWFILPFYPAITTIINYKF